MSTFTNKVAANDISPKQKKDQKTDTQKSPTGVDDAPLTGGSGSGKNKNNKTTTHSSVSNGLEGLRLKNLAELFDAAEAAAEAPSPPVAAFKAGDFNKAWTNQKQLKTVPTKEGTKEEKRHIFDKEMGAATFNFAATLDPTCRPDLAAKLEVFKSVLNDATLNQEPYASANANKKNLSCDASAVKKVLEGAGAGTDFSTELESNEALHITKQIDFLENPQVKDALGPTLHKAVLLAWCAITKNATTTETAKWKGGKVIDGRGIRAMLKAAGLKQKDVDDAAKTYSAKLTSGTALPLSSRKDFKPKVASPGCSVSGLKADGTPDKRTTEGKKLLKAAKEEAAAAAAAAAAAKLKRSIAAKKGWDTRRANQAEADEQKQRAEAVERSKAEAAAERTKRSIASKKGWDTRRANQAEADEQKQQAEAVERSKAETAQRAVAARAAEQQAERQRQLQEQQQQQQQQQQERQRQRQRQLEQQQQQQQQQQARRRQQEQYQQQQLYQQQQAQQRQSNAWNTFQHANAGMGYSRSGMSQAYHSYAGGAPSSGGGGGRACNSWNAFQSAHGGQGLSRSEMSAAYHNR